MLFLIGTFGLNFPILPNAVALNSMSFNAAQMIGPAVAGLLIAKIGIGWAFLLNGLSFGAMLLSMCFFHIPELCTSPRAHRSGSGFLEGLRYVWSRSDQCLCEAGLISPSGLPSLRFPTATTCH